MLQKYLLYTLPLVLFGFAAQAQIQGNVSPEAKENLLLASEHYAIQYLSEREAALSHARQHNLPTVEILADGQAVYLDRMLPSGELVYITSHNQRAARTTETDQVQVGGRLGLGLDGRGFVIGVFEVGIPNAQHQELNGRVQVLDPPRSEEEQSDRNHATHVNGTVLAAGVNPSARGIAYGATSMAFTAQGDVTKMGREAGAGLLFSNHSYGPSLGWDGDGERWRGVESISTREDYRFGFYNQTCQILDQLAVDAPYYTMVWSAGNHRNDSGDGSRDPDGPYDCIGGSAVTKNGITVGAVSPINNGYRSPASVVMSNFSSWGPIDDGRIKPDFVASGVNVLSSGGNDNDSYITLQGTSMSAPNAAASLMLLQQLHTQLNDGRLLKAATLKGLAIHTVHEAGETDGPDYSFGWGLLNTAHATNVLFENGKPGYHVEELSLSNGQVFEMDMEIGEGNTQPLKATICWTDPAGTPVAPQLNPRNPMLVNDLDLRIFGPDGTEHFPWKLDPVNPTRPATKEDNKVDNVEQVEIKNPAPGVYRIVVSHKGNGLTSGKQDFALIATSQPLADQRRTLYWVGGSGDWDDPAHWALGSGGTPGQPAPGPEDRVIFNVESFPGSDPATVSLKADAACFSLTWVASRDVELNTSFHSLDIAANVNLDNEKLVFKGTGGLRFLGTGHAGNLVYANADFGNGVLHFDNPDAKWVLQSDLKGGQLILSSGTFSAKGKKLDLIGIGIEENGLPKTLDLTNATIDNLQLLALDAGNLDLRLDGASLLFKGADRMMFDSQGGLEIAALEVEGGTLTVSGQNSYASVKVASQLVLSNGGSVQALEMEGGSKLALGGTLNVFSFIARGGNGNPVVLEGVAGGPAVVRSTDTGSRRICFDFLAIDGVRADGDVRFVAGANSQLANAPGWFPGSCADQLFADFETGFACAGGLAELRDLSTGGPQTWLWRYRLGNNEQTFEGRTANITFPQVGEYEVSLTVGKDGQSDTYTKQVNVRAGTLAKPQIRLDEGILRTTAVARFFQWYRNGEPIPEATGSFIIIEAGRSASYVVEATDANCRMISDPYVITSLQGALASSLQVYPNPTAGRFSIAMENSLRGKVQASVYDVLGRLVKQGSGDKNSAAFALDLDISGLAKGMYFVETAIGGVNVKKKIMLE